MIYQHDLIHVDLDHLAEECVSCFFTILRLTFNTQFKHHPEKAMAAHSSTLAWKIPWVEEPGRLQSMGSRRVGHD